MSPEEISLHHRISQLHERRRILALALEQKSRAALTSPPALASAALLGAALGAASRPPSRTSSKHHQTAAQTASRFTLFGLFTTCLNLLGVIKVLRADGSPLQ